MTNLRPNPKEGRNRKGSEPNTARVVRISIHPVLLPRNRREELGTQFTLPSKEMAHADVEDKRPTRIKGRKARGEKDVTTCIRPPRDLKSRNPGISRLDTGKASPTGKVCKEASELVMCLLPGMASESGARELVITQGTLGRLQI